MADLVRRAGIVGVLAAVPADSSIAAAGDCIREIFLSVAVLYYYCGGLEIRD
jgi:hypothetical protein